MIQVSIRADIKAVTAGLQGAARKQIPYAVAQAINVIAFEVQRAERAAMSEVFKRPRPFTQRSVLVTKATKASPIATVYIRPEAAAYLEPFEDGGVHHKPGTGRAILNPKAIKLDSYGQIRGKPSAIAQRDKVFAGRVMTKGGAVWGFWRRLNAKKGGPRLQLLVRAGEALPVHTRLGFDQRARAIVAKRARAVLTAALDRALASARG